MISPTYLSAIIVVLVSLFQVLKINITKEDLEPLLTALFTLISGCIILWRRFKKGGINVLGVYRK